MRPTPAIECQCCGETIRYLNTKEAQEVARNPYNFIWYCYRKECQEAAREESRRDGLL